MVTDTKVSQRSLKAELVRAELRRPWRTASDREIATDLEVGNKMEADGEILPRHTKTHPIQSWPEEVCRLAIEPCPLSDIVYEPSD